MVASFLLILLAVALYGLVHSWLASLGVKAYMRRLLGDIADRTYRLAYNIFAVVSFLPVLALVALLPDRTIYIIHFPWALLFVAGQGLALLGLFIGLRQTGVWEFLGLQQLAHSSQGENNPSQFVARGLYCWVRHPLYAAGLLFIWLAPVMTLNLLALNLSLTAYIVVGAVFEERKLSREFGETYHVYQQSTPMLIPNPLACWKRGTRS